MIDGDPPSCSRSVMRKARKPHWCCECGRTIQPREHYEHMSGIWDGEPSSYSTCARCLEIRRCHCAGQHALGEYGYTIGSLREEIRDMAREEPYYLAVFRAAWKGEPAPAPPERDLSRGYSWTMGGAA